MRKAPRQGRAGADGGGGVGWGGKGSRAREARAPQLVGNNFSHGMYIYLHGMYI